MYAYAIVKVPSQTFKLVSYCLADAYPQDERLTAYTDIHTDTYASIFKCIL